MKTTRLEAFSDGVLAIIITIMVLELKVPHAVELAALKPVFPVLLSYVLSFIYVGIYWNNHHHLFQAAEQVSGGILWANLHLLFWLSLFPFTTAWMGENHLAAIPTAVYGFVLLMAGIAYYVLERAIIAKEGRESFLAQAVGKEWKAKIIFKNYIKLSCEFNRPLNHGNLHYTSNNTRNYTCVISFPFGNIIITFKIIYHYNSRYNKNTQQVHTY